MIYLVMFSISGLFFYLSQKTSGALRFCVLIVAIAFPCLMAGFRDASVGTDLGLWGVYTYEAAKSMPLVPFLGYHADEAGIAFNLLAWVGAQMGNGIVPFLSLIQLAAILPFYMGIKALYPNQVWIGMLFYLLFLYPPSLNTMKQIIAVSVVVYGMKYLIDRSLRKYVCCVVVAMLFHQTAIAAMMFYPAAVLLGPENAGGGRPRRIALLVLLTLAIFCVVFFTGVYLVTYLAGLKESYATEVATLGQGRFNWSILILIVGLLLVYVFRTDFRQGAGALGKMDIVLPIAAYCVVWGCFAFELGMISPALSRFSYFGTSMMAFVICGISDSKNSKATLLSAALIFIVLVYFVFNFIIRGGESIYPYASAILGI